MKKRDAEKRRARMRAVVSKFQTYVGTYHRQAYYEDYSDKTYLDDMLYGIGLSLAEGTPIDYTGPGGYERFKAVLFDHLSSKPGASQHEG